MSLYALLRNHPSPTDEQIEESFDGNLCRCTGYRPILDAAKTFSCGKKDCCRNGSTGGDGSASTEKNGADTAYTPMGMVEVFGCCRSPCFTILPSLSCPSHVTSHYHVNLSISLHLTITSICSSLCISPSRQSPCPNPASNLHVNSLPQTKFKKYDSSQEIIFPPALANRLQREEKRSLRFTSRRCTWIQPVSLEELLECMVSHDDRFLNRLMSS